MNYKNKLKSVRFAPTGLKCKSKENLIYSLKKTKKKIQSKYDKKKVFSPKRRSSKQLKPKILSDEKKISFKINRKSSKKLNRIEPQPFFDCFLKNNEKIISFKEKYKVLKILGNGSNSRVFLCRNRISKEYFAVKIVSKNSKDNQIKNLNVALFKL